ncbi:MAG: msrA [Bacteroidetes bacterium]|nr:msrA [Bacteroidota bacterium]
MKKLIYILTLALCSEYANAQERHLSEATFASGCFWHEQALFQSVRGVDTVISGYAGGTTANPTYEQVETGTTGHAETVNIKYDSTKISYLDLLKVFIESEEDPTQIDGQGPDKGQQYRSIIFYRNKVEKAQAENYILKLNKSGKYKGTISAQIVPFTKFYKAEEYHQDYVSHNPTNGYVQTVSIPAIKKYQHGHPGMIKDGRMLK